mgnify:CR=1 FL=1
MSDTTSRLAIAAHLHVLLRRRTGRVTDTEWMAVNQEYAAEIVRYARAQAAERGAPELAEWAGKLEQPTLGPVQAPPAPVGVRASALNDTALSSPAATDAPPPPDDTARYVGGIR